ncbi:biopolymer transporter ExbD [candidate division TA06 bacterium]|uniref:Biopolymer transporter ExbD n=1 Tax=candidate division TA06 bacterium TaxID=2250710 RepID=A0A933IA59_UNCT6|nr:biopolymer transporter ExbD [candidate division TA06 bacterium]
MRRQRSGLQPMAMINMTNLIDVCMVLLITFMITAPMMRSGMDVALPKSSSTKPQVEEGLTITLTSGGKIIVSNQTVSQSAFPKVIKGILATNPSQPVYLKADKTVPYGLVVEVIGQLKELKVTNLGLVTEPKMSK